MGLLQGFKARGAAIAGFLALAAALTPAVADAAAAWWQNDWPFRKEVIVDTTSTGVAINEPIGRSPVLVRLHSGNFTFEDTATGGADLRFVAADDKTPLAFHVESFDPLLGVANIWVDVPEYPVGAKRTFWMYYGNKEAQTGADTPATFDPNYSAVYHFDAAAGAAPKDKTAYANDATSPPGAVDEASVIGLGGKFTGGGAMVIPAKPPLAVAAGSQLTVSLWVKPDTLQPMAALFARRDAGGALVIGLEAGAPFAEIGGQRLLAPTPVAAGQWSHVAVVVAADGATLYVNGKPAATAAAAAPALNGPIAVGGDAAGGTLPGFTGSIDELRISKVARPAALMLADATSQGADSRLVTFGEDEKQGHGGFEWFGFILKSVTIDAWVVIGILSVMAALSWWVMYAKVSYVGRVDKANDRFLKLFHKHAVDPMTLADDSKLEPGQLRQIKDSSIYRIYKAGADEIRQREVRGHTVLRGEAIEVVRALMDSSLVRENQKLSSGVVLLTISISGGPFLGLLGTVVGVMITFASIAMAGDVNVNAIAPGIAAALLATVAGLAVAIPAMFGYNYILTRNKSVTANMQVFADEFLTRVSELYSGDPPHLARAAE